MTEAEKLEASRRILAYNRSRAALEKAKVIEVGYRSQAERDAAERRQFSKTKAKAPKKPAYDYLSDDWRL
jgi:hypothetical protein